MVKSRILRATAVAATSFGLVAGFAGIAGASAGSIANTGPDSSNKIVTVSKAHLDVNNDNHLFLASHNDQASSTGDAGVFHNTTGGGASTGNASNSTSLAASVAVSNSTPTAMLGDSSTATGGGSIDTTGPDSTNKVVTVNKTSVDVNNDNNVMVMTSNEQSATSGDAKVAGNTTGGSATTGNASNTSTSSFTISIQN